MAEEHSCDNKRKQKKEEQLSNWASTERSKNWRESVMGLGMFDSVEES